jgi:motility quorum-sensing regulator/GCU-specific mRNA interferase toxin
MVTVGVMEKWLPHYGLDTLKELIREGKVDATTTAYRGARLLGIPGLDGMCEIVLSLASADFHKSMTTHADHRVWQDVYRPNTAFGGVYLKLTIVDDVLIVSFKEL